MQHAVDDIRRYQHQFCVINIAFAILGDGNVFPGHGGYVLRISRTFRTVVIGNNRFDVHVIGNDSMNTTCYGVL